MSGRFPDGYSGAIQKVNDASDRALYPYLQVGVFGPYAGDCQEYLKEVCLSLADRGFEECHIASDVTPDAPEDYDGTQNEYWYEKSLEFFSRCDVAIFFFLADEIQRAEYLPDRAFNELDSTPTERTATPDLNGSVAMELGTWVERVDPAPDKTLVVYEEQFYDGGDGITMVLGGVDYEGLDDRVIDTHEIDEAVSHSSSFISNVAMGPLKDILQDRYYGDMQ